MSPTEKKYKTLIALYFLIFTALEIPFSKAWLDQQGGLWGTHLEFWHQVFHDPLYQVTTIDFGTTACLVFLWMAWDSKRRGHIFRAWLWLPIFLVCPSVGIIGYLLTRQGWEFPLTKT